MPGFWDQNIQCTALRGRKNTLLQLSMGNHTHKPREKLNNRKVGEDEIDDEDEDYDDDEDAFEVQGKHEKEDGDATLMAVRMSMSRRR